jgi:hypothetical protein
MLRKFGIIAVLSLIVTAIAAIPALAVAPTSVTETGGLHVCQGSVLDVSAESTSAGKLLRVTGEICGAGNRASATLTATAEATVGCVTRNGQGEPTGLRRVREATAASDTIRTRQGRGTFNFTTEALSIDDFNFSCPSAQQREVLVGPVNFTDITLTITSGPNKRITATFPDIDP